MAIFGLILIIISILKTDGQYVFNPSSIYEFSEKLNLVAEKYGFKGLDFESIINNNQIQQIHVDVSLLKGTSDE